jgi:MFS family permease
LLDKTKKNMLKDQRRLLILSSLGGVLEFYDFIIFAIFASYISNAFFPATNRFSSLFVAFATFAIGYLVRPIGGIIFGHFGDRVGRKTTFTISILMMAVATLGIGLLPSYDSWGITAPIIIIFLRIMQGLSVGGEIPGAITYISEAFPDRKGLSCGVIFCALTMGIVLGSLVYAVITSLLSEKEMRAFGWRIPFVLGGGLGLFSYILRRGLHESAQFLALEQAVERFPIVFVFKQQFAKVIGGSLMVAVCAVIITSLFLFTPAYFTEVLHFPPNIYIWQRSLAIGLGSILTILFGYMTDVFNPKKLFVSLIFFIAILAYPIFMIYVDYPAFFLLSLAGSALLMGFSAGIIPRMISELFPTKIRYSGIAVSYNLGFALFGGLTPFISLSLIYYTGSLVSPALYLLIVSCLGILSLLLIDYPHRKDKTLDAKIIKMSIF